MSWSHEWVWLGHMTTWNVLPSEEARHLQHLSVHDIMFLTFEGERERGSEEDW